MSAVLQIRSSNTQVQQGPPPTIKDDGKTTVTKIEEPQVDKENARFENKSANQAYVSPSDAIMSPASKKLSAFKQRQYSKATPSRSLFRKAVTAREKDFGPLQ